MSHPPDHRLPSRVRWPAPARVAAWARGRRARGGSDARIAALALTLATALALTAPVAQAARRASAGASAGQASRYPAGATRPLVRPKASQYARSAGAGSASASGESLTGGASAGSGGSSSGSSSGGSSGGGSAPSSSSRGRSKKGGSHSKAKPKPTLHGDPARALLAFEAMQRAYYIRGSGLYQGEPFSFLWPFSQALAATVTLSNMTEVSRVPGLSAALSSELKARLVGLRSYLDLDNSGAPEGVYISTLPAYDGTVAPPTGPGGTKYYDDNEWVGIELMRHWKLTHTEASLGSAEGIMAFVMAGWSTNPELACPGGVPFSNSAENHDRNTVTDAPGAELAVQLYWATHKPEYLQFAIKAYEWVRTCLLQPNGLYADHIGPKGAVEKTYWSYNQGTMIGAGTLLYQATGNAEYLYQARQTAKAAQAYLTPERLGAETPFFPAVYFRNLLYLDSITHDPPGPRAAQAYVDYAWQHLRLSNDLFVFGSPPTGQLLTQASIVQIYGLLSSPPSTYF